MSSIRDHLSDARWRASNGRVKVSDAWYRAAGRRIDGARTDARNKRNRRVLEAGKLPRRDLLAAGVASRVPVYRNRVNPGHGNRHREDARIARTADRSLRRQKAARAAETQWPAVEDWERGPDACRSQPAARNQGGERTRHGVTRWDDPFAGLRGTQARTEDSRGRDAR